MVSMTALMAMVSLGVDLGRVQLTKTELQRAADAAARSAVAGIEDNTHLQRAQSVALENLADGKPVELQSDDVLKGNWDAKLNPPFSTARSPANAVRVTARRIAARGTGVPTLFMRVLGWNTCDVTAHSTCLLQNGGYAYAVIGMEWIQLLSNASVDSYDSRIGAYHSGHTPDKGTVASNGSIQLAGGVVVHGDARPGPGNHAIGGTVTGIRAALESAISFAPPVAVGPYNNAAIPANYISNSNFLLDSATYTLPAGTYLFNNFTMKNNAVLQVDGSVTIYVSGDLDIDGDARTGSHRPNQLKFRVTGNGQVRLVGNNGVWADIVAPLASVLIDSNKHVYGAVIGRTVRLDSNAQLHVDEALLEEGDVRFVLVN